MLFFTTVPLLPHVSVPPITISEMWAAHSLTVNIHSVYVNKLMRKKNTSLSVPIYGRPELEELIHFRPTWVEIPQLLQWRHVRRFSRELPVLQLFGNEGTTSFLPFFTPGEPIRSTTSSNFMLTSRRLIGMINTTLVFKELIFEWMSKLYQEKNVIWWPFSKLWCALQ